MTDIILYCSEFQGASGFLLRSISFFFFFFWFLSSSKPFVAAFRAVTFVLVCAGDMGPSSWVAIGEAKERDDGVARKLLQASSCLIIQQTQVEFSEVPFFFFTVYKLRRIVSMIRGHHQFLTCLLEFNPVWVEPNGV